MTKDEIGKFSKEQLIKVIANYYAGKCMFDSLGGETLCSKDTSMDCITCWLQYLKKHSAKNEERRIYEKY